MKHPRVAEHGTPGEWAADLLVRAGGAFIYTFTAAITSEVTQVVNLEHAVIGNGPVGALVSAVCIGGIGALTRVVAPTVMGAAAAMEKRRQRRLRVGKHDS